MEEELNPQLFVAMEAIADNPGGIAHFADKWELIRVSVECRANGRMPPFPPQTLRELVLFAKDQGNSMFKKKLFPFARDLYAFATIIAHILNEMGFSQSDDKELASALFSNLAFTYIKLEQYQHAVEHADRAISLNINNTKAYHRKVVALKSLSLYSEALKAAEYGETRSRLLNLNADIKTFEELISQLRPNVPAAQPAPPPNSSSYSGASTGRTRGSTVPAPAPSTAPPARATVSVSLAKAEPKTNGSDVDNSWLKGTNVNVSKKQETRLSRPVSKKQKGKKKKGSGQSQSPRKNQQATQRRFTQRADDTSSSEEESSDGSEDEQSESEGSHFDDNLADLGFSKTETTMASAMGLDDFIPVNRGRNAVDEFGFTVVGNYPSKTPQIRMSTPPPLPQSLDEYNVRLACPKCFVKDSEGILGSRLKPGFQHLCNKEFLLARKKSEPNGLWLKIRARPQKMSTTRIFSGKFRLCQQFQANMPCKIGEPNCTFAHSLPEIDFWTAEREGQFYVATFTEQLRKSGYGEDSGISSNASPSPTLISEQPIQTTRPSAASFTPFLPASTTSSFSNPHTSVTQTAPKSNTYRPAPQAPTETTRPPLLPTLTPTTVVDQYRQSPPPILYNEYRPSNDVRPAYNQEYRQPFGADYRQRQGYNGMQTNYPPQHQPYYRQSPNVLYQSNLQGGISYIEVDRSPQAIQNIPPQSRYNPRPIPVPQNAAPLHFPGATMPKKQELSTQDTPQEFPLVETHDFALVCKTCLYQAHQFSMYYIDLKRNHQCNEDLLIVKKKGERGWAFIRDRMNHRDFPGNYILCRYFTATPPSRCMIDPVLCSFAHFPEEQYIWGLEKESLFNIQAFVLSNRNKKKSGFTVEELFKKYGGHFNFICGACFFGMNCSISLALEGVDLCSRQIHKWSLSKQLIHVHPQGSITAIDEPPFVHRHAFFLICGRLQYCQRRQSGRCNFAHSQLERDVWYVERDTRIPRDDLVALSDEYQTNIVQEKYASSQPQTAINQAPKPSAPGPTTTTTAPEPTPALPAAAELAPAVLKCPFSVVEVCKLCKGQGRISKQKGDRCNGPGNGHQWRMNRCFMLESQKKEMRPLPRKIPLHCNFIICRHIRETKKCDYQAGNCQFAHSQHEADVWAWMVKNNVKTLEELVEICKTSNDAPTKTTKIAQGQSVVQAAPIRPPISLPHRTLNLQTNSQYCHYCSEMCPSQRRWDEHCASEKHMFNVNSDKEHQWNYRQPAWGVHKGQYEMCQLHARGQCPHSDKRNNLCQYAHSIEELDEWKERWQWRQMKREIAKQKGMYSYMEDLQEAYADAESGINVIADMLNGVQFTCDRDLNVYKQDKSCSVYWTFTLRVKKGVKLSRVALLEDRDRLHFSLVGEDLDARAQIAQGSTFISTDQRTYSVKVKFEGGMFGSFLQWVVFDFGCKPVLGKKLNVELGSQEAQEKVFRLRQELDFDRWTTDNREIVYFDKSHTSESIKQLLKQYRLPASAELVINQQSLDVSLNSHNYSHKMHTLLFLEELNRHQIISSFNLKTTLELQESIHEQVMIFVHDGELFARVPLNGQLSDDTDAGKLILESVSRLLLAPQDNSRRVVYEAVIVQKENYDYDGRGKDYIYICLSPECCSALRLTSGDRIDVEIQFQMSRLPFCRWHKAVDHLQDATIVFPDLDLIKDMGSQRQAYAIRSQVLNDDQLSVIRHVIIEHGGYTPPLVIYGPFGTGKTETLAQAAMLLLSQQPSSHILICTHSNSAADLYISKHFDAFAQKHPGLKLLRIYAEERRLNTVQPVIKKYCCLTPDKSRFALPSVAEIKNHHVVIVTLSTSLHMASDRGLVGHFEFILMDEAAQALECEAIMPLSLATKTTCVMLAGDHMQISPKVYSIEARKQKFDCSLLERLFRHYKSAETDMLDSPSQNVLLRINYRTRMEILRFVAAVFYGDPDLLVSQTNQPPTNKEAMIFYAAYGREVQEPDSTSYYNKAEIEEIVDRVDDLYRNWPEEWGPCDTSTIGVVTPYYDQVLRLRMALRRKDPKLTQVQVERVMNVQGKEFRALFISTVRTSHMAEDPPVQINEDGDCDNEIGDLGFLSDEKLLNTAITRAQSMVAVVGDPIALCAIGRCMNIWRAYLKHCTQMKTIYPSTVTLATVRSRVISMMESPVGANLLMLSNLTMGSHMERIPQRRSQQQARVSAPKAVEAMVTEKLNSEKRDSAKVEEEEEGEDEDEEEDSDSGTEEVDASLNPFDMAAKVGFFDDWGMDYTIEPDEILKQLARVSIQHQSQNKTAWASPPQSQGDATLPPVDLSTPLKIEDVHVKRLAGHAIVQYKPGKQEQEKQRKLLSANDFDRPYNSDSDDSDVERQELGGDRTIYADFSPPQLNGFLQKHPDKFKHCILKIQSSMNMYARDLDPRSGHKQIKINSRLRCGRGFDNDEVVVEVLKSDEDDLRALQETEKDVIQGKVIGILKRAVNPKYRMFVCSFEEGNTGLMVPLNRGIPKILNLELLHLHKKAKKGHVIVYTFTRNKEIIFHHYEPVDPSNPGTKLFIVRYLKWDPNFYSPLGIVVGVLPAGTSIEDGLKILDLEYYIPKEFKGETTKEMERIYHPNFKIPTEALNDRLDYRDKLTFTIDPPEAQDLDDAISVEFEPGHYYKIGVHIADVSHFIKIGTYIDTEAKTRGSSYYPVGRPPVPMIPERLSTDLCSLKPNEDRLTLSMFFTVNHECEILKAVPRRCVIRSKHRLTYDDAESILTDVSEDLGEGILNSMFLLQRIGQTWRKKRLGNGAIYQQLSEEDSSSPNAHLIVEELMLMTNHYVAKILLKEYPRVTPLRQQQSPNELELAAWRSLYQKEALESVALTRAYLPKGQVCNCQHECTCVEPTTFVPGKDFVDVTKATWKKIEEALEDDDLDLVEKLIIDPELHPQLAVANRELRYIQERGLYVCSGDVSDDDMWHYSLNFPAYTHFTSPIRRFIDLVVHRLVSALIDHQPAPYTQMEVKDIAAHCSEVAVKANRYESATHSLHLTTAASSKPMVLYPVVQSVAVSDLQLLFPTVKDITPSQSKISLRQLSLAGAPQLITDNKVDLTWQRRIYDVKKSILKPADRGTKPHIDTNQYVMKIPAHLWNQMVSAILQDDKERLYGIFDDTLEAMKHIQTVPGHISDVSSEVGNQTLRQHYYEFGAAVGACTILRVQVASNLIKGLMAPKIQLLSLTPTFDICLEHRSDPVHSFAELTVTQASRQNYGSEDAYRDNWLSVLRMEAAVCSLSSDESAVIHNAPIVWRKKGNEKIYAICTLPLGFCVQRHINISAYVESEYGDLDKEQQQEAVSTPIERLHTYKDLVLAIHSLVRTESRNFDYICVRYSDVTVEPLGESESSVLKDMTTSETVTWVGHCLVTMVTRDTENDRLTVHMNLHQSLMKLPPALLTQDEKNPRRATIEWIPKTLPDRRMEKALCDLPLPRTSALARDIALGRNPAELESVPQLSDLTSAHIASLNPPNVCQQQALRYALEHSFSLIQGPPGTGKTVTGVRLAYILAQLNMKNPKPMKKTVGPQVMYCGPSNKSVDVVAAYLKRLGPSCPKIIRVYSEMIEKRDFPLPNDPLSPRARGKQASSAATPSPSELELRDVALHHLIRKEGKPFSEQIVSMDLYFKQQGDDVTLKEVQNYQQLVANAEIVELKTAEIILCTCTASSSFKILFSANIKQLIIDECGMCTEPEAMVPIVALNPRQVVLIGDHKQLRPIVLNAKAKNLGLEKSLFERYSDKAQMLTVQYRMHEAIAEFPSQHFYGGSLTCGRDEQSKSSSLKFWPGGKLRPLTFVHVVGCEQSLSVATSDGNEQSKSNQEEVSLAVRAATLLVRRFHIKSRDVVVLSQYQAQCAEIKRQLHLKSQDDTEVCTVIASQGSEWDYVVLSTVRSLPKSQIEKNPTRGWVLRNLGFITDQNQINVAITRARKGLIIIGNKYLLKVDRMWKALIDDYESNKQLTDGHDFMTKY